MKILNGYSLALGSLYEKAPKSVLAAIAVSFASCGGDHLDTALADILREWWVLYDNGIVKQRPPMPRVPSEDPE